MRRMTATPAVARPGPGSGVDPVALVERLAAGTSRADRLTHLERIPARPAVAEAVAGLGRPDPGGGVRRARRHRAVAAPGPGGRARARRAARRARHRHCVGEVARLPVAGADRDPRRPRPAGAARIEHALPGADQGARPGPARLDRRARPGRPDRDPRRRQHPGAARVDARPRRVRPHQPRHAAPLAAAHPRPVGTVPRDRRLRGRRRVPPLPRRVRRPCRAGAATAPPGVCRARRRADLHPGVGDGGRAGGGRPAADRAATSWRSPTTTHPAARSRSGCGSRR